MIQSGYPILDWEENGGVALFRGDAGQVLDRLALLHEPFVQLVVTSPPYYRLRQYGDGEWAGGDLECDHKPGNVSRVGKTTLGGGTSTAGHQQEGYGKECRKCGAVRLDQGEIGGEATPGEYIARLVDVFRKVRRVLRDDGLCVVVLGDTYMANRGYQIDGTKQTRGSQTSAGSTVPAGWKVKDMGGIPWRFAFAMQEDGWWLRHALPWVKRNAMPNSQDDRPTTSVEYVFMFAPSQEYFWDQDAVRVQTADGASTRYLRDSDLFMTSLQVILAGGRGLVHNEAGDPLAVVTNVARYAGPHYATFPPELIEPFIRAGTSAGGACPRCGTPRARKREESGGNQPEKRQPTQQGTKGRVSHAGSPPQQSSAKIQPAAPGTGMWVTGCTCPVSLNYDPCVVLDPFVGSGTTAEVAASLGRQVIGIDVHEPYIRLAVERANIVRYGFAAGIPDTEDV